MATKYSQAGFNFNTSSGEIAGVASKIATMVKWAKKEDTIATLKELKEKNSILIEAIKVLEIEAIKEQNKIIASIKQDYSAIYNNVKRYLISPTEARKKAAQTIFKYLKPSSEIFTSKKNTTLANIKSIIQLMEKCDEENYQQLCIEDFFNQIKENSNLYSEKFPDITNNIAESKDKSLKTRKEAVIAIFRKLRSILDYHQSLTGCEEKVVTNANEVWKLARQGQIISKKNKKKNDDDKDKDKDENNDNDNKKK